MKLKIEITDKEKHILYRVLVVILSITVLSTGIYTISFFETIGLIKGLPQILLLIGLHFLQWWLVMRAVFKYYS